MLVAGNTRSVGMFDDSAPVRHNRQVGEPLTISAAFLVAQSVPSRRNATVNCLRKRIERLWRREGLNVPQKQPKRRQLWLNDALCVRWRPAYKNHFWSYDFVQDRTHDRRGFQIRGSRIMEHLFRRLRRRKFPFAVKNFLTWSIEPDDVGLADLVRRG